MSPASQPVAFGVLVLEVEELKDVRVDLMASSGAWT